MSQEAQKSKPKVLLTTPIMRHPAAGGPYLRVENTIKALSQISDLYIYSRVSLTTLGGVSGLSFLKQYCSKFYFAPFADPKTRHIRYVQIIMNVLSRGIFNRNVFSIGRESEKDFRDLLRVADDISPDVIWLSFGNISYPLLKYIKSHSDYPVVLDTDSVWSRFVLRGLPFAEDEEEYQRIQGEGKAKEEEERWGTQLADITTAVSEVDADYYRMLAKHPEQIHLFSNVVDIADYEQIAAPIEDLKHPCIYLAGTFGPRSPMDDAARWVVEGVLPLARRQIPDLHFYIVGKGADKTLVDINDAGITIVGEVPCVLPYLGHADIAVVPLRFESGTRFKILEAGACGIPVVSTNLGAEGIPVTHEKDILIADEPQSFADSIFKLLTNRGFALKMAKNLKTLIHEKYTIASLVEEGFLILEHLMTKPKGEEVRVA
jgi:glycosyltransferase involved in cell wall biosynthesis